MCQNDRDAFARFVDRFGAQVHRLARRYARTDADAEDLTQEIFVALIQHIGSFRGEAALSTWVYRVALNHGMKHGSRAAARPESMEIDDLPIADTDPNRDPQNRALQSELASKVGKALHDLSDGHREVVVLHELHGLTYQECADVLGVPVGTVKSRLFHAFGKLRGKLGAYVRGDENETEHTGNRAEAGCARAVLPAAAPVGTVGKPRR